MCFPGPESSADFWVFLGMELVASGVGVGDWAASFAVGTPLCFDVPVAVPVCLCAGVPVALSAWATAVPLARAAPTPSVIAPAPSH